MTVEVTLPQHLSYSQCNSMTTCGEEWRPVPDAPGYEVSNMGRVRTYRYKNGSWLKDPVIRGTAKDRQGYNNFKIGRYEGVRRVHRMVLWAFVGPPPFEGAVARHLDDNKDNNALSNLAWGTHQDNSDDRVRNGKARCGKLYGEDAPGAKLTWAEVREIRSRRAAGAMLQTLASYYGVSDSTISLICLNKVWKEGE